MKKLIVALFGGALYSLAEILFRGYTHWSMTITGGICLLLIYSRYEKKPREPLAKKCVYGALVITAAEFTAGCIVNLWLKWDVWDYSAHPFNIMGQICPLFTAMWFFITIPAVWLCRAFERRFRVLAA